MSANSKKIILLVLLIVSAPVIYFSLKHYYQSKLEQDFPFLKPVATATSFGNFTGTVTFKKGRPVHVIVPSKRKSNPFPGNVSV